MSSGLCAVGLKVAGDLLTPRHATPSEVERSNLDTIARLRAVPVETLPELYLTSRESWSALDTDRVQARPSRRG
jgi:hypothetical protein